MTPDEFKERFPEFDTATITDAQVQSKLDQAERSMDSTVWGDLFDDGQGQYAAHLLALSPEGQDAGLRMGGGANQRTVYQQEYEKLARRVGGAYRAVLP